MAAINAFFFSKWRERKEGIKFETIREKVLHLTRKAGKLQVSQTLKRVLLSPTTDPQLTATYRIYLK